MDQVQLELIADFVVESREGLSNIENQMLTIESAGANTDLDLVNAVFRTMHSIKGTAGFLGLNSIGSLAHGLEEVLNDLRNREVMPTSELISSVLRAADYMKELLDSVDASNEANIGPFVKELQKFRQGAKVAEVTSVQSTTEHDQPAQEAVQASHPAVAGESSDLPVERVQLSAAVRDFLIECYENLDQMERDLVNLEETPTSESLIRTVFRTIHTIKGGAGFLALGTLEKLTHVAESLLNEIRSGKRRFTSEISSVLLKTVDKCREALDIVEMSGTDKGLDLQPVLQDLLNFDESKKVVIEAANVTSEPTKTKVDAMFDTNAAVAVEEVRIPPVIDTPDKESANNNAVNPSAAADSAANDKANTPIGETTIRVDVALLDKLMTRVGELVLARNQILRHTTNANDSIFTSAAQRLNLITTELQESVMKTRMQPIGNVWSKFPRVVRDLASQLGKQVNIEMEGKETELDKTIIEAIKDPLTHLVRNSVDHGIESPDKRAALGKPKEGTLTLRAFHEGGQVNIEIADDGAGLHLEKIRAKAVERGIVTCEQATRMSDREAAQLILLPGFSTAEKITNVSGRGVGMDVVKTNIERIGGMIDVQSEFGHGTTVKIKIPLTLAVIPALIVTNCGDRYAIPQVSLLELVRLEGEEAKKKIEFVHGAPVYRLRGKLLPLVDLTEQLKLNSDKVKCSRSAGDAAVNIVVLRANNRQYGLMVDEVNDTEEIVVKPLSRQLKSIHEYAGTTIMGDGTVALILDVMGLATASGLTPEIRETSHNNKSKDEDSVNLQSLLVVDLGDVRRFALPTSMVARLEKVAKSEIEYANGREVIQYRDDILPLIRLSNVFGQQNTKQNTDGDLIQIVVYAEEGHQCGFVVNRILDIVETDLRMHARDDSNKYLLGTAVIQEHVTDVLNLRRLARSPKSKSKKSHKLTPVLS